MLHIPDTIIVGAGPAGIFTAYELASKLGPKHKILLIEKGKKVSERHCPKDKYGGCVKCKNCAITTGFSGAGAFSDGKLSLSPEVGGELPELIGYDTVEALIRYVDGIYLSLGASPKIEGLNTDDAIKEIRRKSINAGLKLVNCPIRHLGTEEARTLYNRLQCKLEELRVDILYETTVTDVVIDNGKCVGVKIKHKDASTENTVFVPGDNIIIATGRRGADWLQKACIDHGIEHLPGTVDIGVRVEVRNEIMEQVNNALYEAKLVGYPKPFKDKVRTFCQNPGGFVAQETYDDGLAVVNGHSFKRTKSNNTNLAILCSHNFTTPFNEPIKYAKMVGELTNMLGGGKLLVQRFVDIIDGKRTWQEELNRSNIQPTLSDAIAGDITAAMPYRAMTSIINFIKALDKVVPGFAGDETLLYSPELKFYSNKIKMDKHLRTNIKHLYCLGDSSGWTRGLMMSSVMGVYMAKQLIESQR